MDRKASAIWKGGLKDGSGVLNSTSRVLDNTAYSFRTRFENEKGTNPEELIAAAHAGCFSMALSGQLGERGITADSIETTATVTMENLTLTKSHLDVVVKAAGADLAKMEEAANAAKAGCPISRVLNAEISMTAKYEN